MVTAVGPNTSRSSHGGGSPQPRHAFSKLAVGGSFTIGRMNDPRTASATGTSPAYFLGRPRAVYVERYRRRSTSLTAAAAPRWTNMQRLSTVSVLNRDEFGWPALSARPTARNHRGLQEASARRDLRRRILRPSQTIGS